MADVVLDLPSVRGRHRNRTLAKARQNRCVQLAAQGWTYEAIKDELGYANRSTAWRHVQQALAEQQSESTVELRDLAAGRLDALLSACWAKAMAGGPGGDPVLPERRSGPDQAPRPGTATGQVHAASDGGVVRGRLPPSWLPRPRQLGTGVSLPAGRGRANGGRGPHGAGTVGLGRHLAPGPRWLAVLATLPAVTRPSPALLQAPFVPTSRMSFECQSAK